MTRWLPRRDGWKAGLIVLSLAAGLITFAPPSTVRAQPTEPGAPLVLAHYYIWFDASSWNRAKIDYPALGRYSSDEATVMRRHVELAKAAGIDGFIVSWKSTLVLDDRLTQLVEIAEELDFGLAITYQGLDFNRDRLPVDRIAEDLDYFIEEFADRAAFDLFDRPLVVLTGTWEFSAAEIALITDDRRDELTVLASEKSVQGYERVAEVVDGDLYYWSSVNPETNPNHAEKLRAMGDAVRQHGGVWIAPAAPGFDARLVGGTTVVERNDGATLRTQWQAALTSIPTAIGVISWNEFSENTHIEPSLEEGMRALEVVADLTGSPRPAAVDFDSSAPQGPPSQSPLRYVALALLLGLIAWAIYRIRSRDRRGATATTDPAERQPVQSDSRGSG